MATIAGLYGDAPGASLTGISLFTISQAGNYTFMAGEKPTSGSTVDGTFTFKMNGTTIATINGTTPTVIKQITVPANASFTYDFAYLYNRPMVAVILAK